MGEFGAMRLVPWAMLCAMHVYRMRDTEHVGCVFRCISPKKACVPVNLDERHELYSPSISEE
jgi:hypothetical protein